MMSHFDDKQVNIIDAFIIDCINIFGCYLKHK